MLLSESKANDTETCLYDSSNVKKSVYLEDKKKLMVFFIKERKKVKSGEGRYFYKLNGDKFLMGSVYIYINVDKKLYENFKKSDSQGNFVNTELSKKSRFINKMKLMALEIEDIVKDTSI